MSTQVRPAAFTRQPNSHCSALALHSNIVPYSQPISVRRYSVSGDNCLRQYGTHSTKRLSTCISLNTSCSDKVAEDRPPRLYQAGSTEQGSYGRRHDAVAQGQPKHHL